MDPRMFFGGGFGGFGGQGRGPSGRPAEEKEDPRDIGGPDDYFKTLGVGVDATPQQIRKAFLKKARKAHPDRGGDVGAFQKLEAAYEVLKDDKTRRLYVDHGAKAAASGEAPGDHASDLGAMFGFGRRPPSGELRPGKPAVYTMSLSLEQLYKGVTKTLKLTRQVIERTATGHVVSDEAETREACDVCPTCRGAGSRTEMRQLGPGMLQQVQAPCADCGGHGFALKDGFRITRRSETVSVEVPAGAEHGQKIRKIGYGDHALGCLPSDLVVQVREREHPTFKRKGHDLLVERVLSLREALCGTTIELTTLDARRIRIPCGGANKAGVLLRPDSVKAVEGEGMPLPDDHFGRGRLFVLFRVKWPEDGALSPAQLAAIDDAFSNRLVPPLARAPTTGATRTTATTHAPPPAQGKQTYSTQLKRWRATKQAAWERGDAKMRAKMPTKEALEAWMDRQCTKAVTKAKAKKLATSSSSSSSSSSDTCSDSGHNSDSSTGAMESKGTAFSAPTAPPTKQGKQEEEEEGEAYVETVQLNDVDLRSFGRKEATGRSAYDEDDEDEGPAGVQCAQQ